MSCSVLLRMRIRYTSVVEKIKTHILFNNLFFFENRAVSDIIWKTTIRPSRPLMTVVCMRTAWCLTKATNTHSEYAICIAVLLQQRLHEHASVLCYTYNACHVMLTFMPYFSRYDID